YAPNVSLTGAGQSVAIVGLLGFFTNDILSYEKLAGLPNVPVVVVPVHPLTGPLGGDSEIETAGDVEMAIAMAPGLSQVLVYEGKTLTDVLNRIATDNLAKQVSCSYLGGIEPSKTLTDQIFEQYAVQGQSFFMGSGDWGAWNGGVNFGWANPIGQ